MYEHCGRHGAGDDSLSRADYSTESSSQALQTSSIGLANTIGYTQPPWIVLSFSLNKLVRHGHGR